MSAIHPPSLIADREHIYQQAVFVRRAAETRLRALIRETEKEFGCRALGLLVSANTSAGALGFKRTHDEDILFYARFPYLFYELYPSIPLAQYDQLALSQYLYLAHVLMLDRLMDGKVLLEPQIAFWANSAYQKILSILHGLFAPTASFWAYFEQCRVENTQALILERVNHTYRIQPYTAQEKVLLFSGKSAMAKAGLVALAALAGQDLPDAVLLSCEAFHVGLQLMDNLQDWRSDYRDHLYTPLLTQVLLDHGLAEQAENTPRADVNQIGSMLYGKNYALTTLHEALSYFQVALYAVKDTPCPAWQNEILTAIQGCQNYLQALEQKLGQIRQKATQPVHATPSTIAPKPEISILAPGASAPNPGWQEALCQAAGLSGAKADFEPFLLGSADYCIVAIEDTLRSCQEIGRLSLLPKIALCCSGRLPASICFKYQETWQIVINFSRFDAILDKQAQGCREQTAYQYGRMLRLEQTNAPLTYLDQMCVHGLGQMVLSTLNPGANLFSANMRWFERNKHYLWQEVLPYLGLSASANLPPELETMTPLLGYDLVFSYCERMGEDALRRCAFASVEDILNKSTVLAVANRISGGETVRFDL